MLHGKKISVLKQKLLTKMCRELLNRKAYT